MQQERATQSRNEPEKEERHITSEESLRSLYLAERSRRSMIQSQLSVPVSIISFSIFGFVSFSQYFNIARWHEPVTATMIVLIVASLASLFTAMVFLARLDRRFVTDDFDRIEAVRKASSEREYFRRAYHEALTANVQAERDRSRAFILLLIGLTCFILAVALMPVHLAGTGVHGR